MNGEIKVLAVDDAVANLAVIKACLRGGRFKLVTATNAADALNLFKSQFFDVLLLDVIMPGVTGFELRKLIRKIDPERPIIFFTSMVEDGSMRLMNEISWDVHTSYLYKKTDKKALTQKIIDATAAYRKWTAERLHSKAMEDERELAGNLQKKFLPKWCILNEKMSCSTLYLPLMRVSGDVYQVYELKDGRQLLFLGDISGHGIAAALYMTAIQAILSQKLNSGAEISAGKLLTEFNDFLCREIDSTTYMTALVAIFDFDRNIVETVNAGHHPLLHCSPEAGTVTSMSIDSSGCPLGWFKDAQYNEENTVRTSFADNDIFCGFTDGILELEDGSRPVGEQINDALKTLMKEPDRTWASLPFRLFDVLKSDGHMPTDDITLLTIQKRKFEPRLIERIFSPELTSVDQVAQEFSSISDDMIQRVQIELCLHEYLNNIIVHGGSRSRGRNAEPMYANVVEKNGVAEICVIDAEASWDISEKKLEEDFSSLEFKEDYTPTSGRGIEILQNTTDHIEYRTFSGVNECRFVMKSNGGTVS